MISEYVALKWSGISLKKKGGEDGWVRNVESTFSWSALLFQADIRCFYLECCLAYPKHISVMVTMIFNVWSSHGAEDACWSWTIKQRCNGGPHCVQWGFVSGTPVLLWTASWLKQFTSPGCDTEMLIAYGIGLKLFRTGSSCSLR